MRPSLCRRARFAVEVGGRLARSRTVAGGAIEGGVFACDRQRVEAAVSRGVYDGWQPGATERARPKAIFPTGVCDYRH